MLRFPRLRAALKFCQLQSTMKKRAEDMISSLYFSRFSVQLFSNLLMLCEVSALLAGDAFLSEVKNQQLPTHSPFSQAKVSLGDQEMLQNLFAHLGSQFGDGGFRSFCREKRGDRSSVTHHTRAGIFGFQ